MEFISCILIIFFYYFLFKWIIEKIKEYLKRKEALEKQKIHIENKKAEIQQRKDEEDKKIRDEALKIYEEIMKYDPEENRVVKNVYNDKNTLRYKVVPRYRKKEYLMTNNEINFYKILKDVADKYHCTIFSQVILYEILEVNESNHWSSKYTSLQNKINRKSIDFTICNNIGRILFCIELDDETHKIRKRKERDAFLDEIFEEADVILIHIKRSNFYDKKYIEELFERILTKIYKIKYGC